MADKDAVKAFPGEQVDVTWDGRLCIHIGECGRSEGDLFVGGRQPWCQPDMSTADHTLDVVKRCPTGALAFVDRSSGLAETPADRNTIMVSPNGPLYVQGDLAIDGASPDMPGVKFRAALCRCGESKNKPFCDNSHEKAAFRDSGAVGQRGEEDAGSGGRLSVSKAPHGPLIINGDCEIIAASGRVAWRGKKAALCRCGQSGNKPFCDGSHKAAGFEAD